MIREIVENVAGAELANPLVTSALEVCESTNKSIHVFTSDFLPFAGCPHTAGGNRGIQIIDALRKAGHSVTFSMPLENFIGRKNRERVLPQLSADERWACENFAEPEVVLNRIQPEIAIYCNVNTFRAVSRFAKEVVHIVDLNGPMQFEGLFVDAWDQQAAMLDGKLLENRCRDIVRKLREVDYAITVSERQKYFWSAYCSLAGFSFADLNILVCPPAFAFSAPPRNPTPNMTVVYSGGFYPWQNPDRFLRSAARILDHIPGATLHIFGEPHAGTPNAGQIKQLLEEVQQHRCVKYHGYRPIEELMAVLSTAWCALELMERSIERELAITGRTLASLASGTPVIYNDYASLSALIESYEAGWTVSTAETSALEGVLKQLERGGIGLVEKLSRNARLLAASEFSGERCTRSLVNLCSGPIKKRPRSTTIDIGLTPRQMPGKRSLGRILAISPGRGSLLELRVNNPMRALQRQGYVDGITITGTLFHELRHDRREYHAIQVQRAVPEFIVETLHTLGLPFALECDDNILARAAYRDQPPELTMILGLRHCTVLTAPNPRLVRALEKYSGLRLGSKAFITPNALPFAGALRREITPPSQILWIQSDIAALVKSREAVVRAVDDFSRRYDLPVKLIGPTVVAGHEFKHQVSMGEIDFTSNLQLLEFAPTSIGVAPLETDTDQETLDFIAGKSDLKVLLFAGYGHCGVYSNSPPYSDSPLQAGLSIVGNSYAEWTEALEYEYREAWKSTPQLAMRLQAQRHIDVVARESWRPALEASLLREPIRGADLYEAFTSAMEVANSTGGPLGYMLGNWDVASRYLTYEGNTAAAHFSQYGQSERRGTRHTLEAQRELLERIERETAARLAQVQELIRHRDTLVHSLRREFAEQRHSLQSEINSLQATIDQLQRDISLAHTTLNGIANSRSWKLTAPLRKATGLLRKH